MEDVQAGKSANSHAYALDTLMKVVTSAVEKLSTIHAELERHYVSCPGLPPGSALQESKDLHAELLYALLGAHGVLMTEPQTSTETRSKLTSSATQVRIEENARQSALDTKMTAMNALRDSAEGLYRLATILGVDLSTTLPLAEAPRPAPLSYPPIRRKNERKCKGCELCPHLSEIFQK